MICASDGEGLSSRIIARRLIKKSTIGSSHTGAGRAVYLELERTIETIKREELRVLNLATTVGTASTREEKNLVSGSTTRVEVQTRVRLSVW